MVLGIILVVLFCISIAVAIVCTLVLQVYFVCLTLDLMQTGSGNSDNIFGKIAESIEKNILNRVR